jgi:hypothetical protein
MLMPLSIGTSTSSVTFTTTCGTSGSSSYITEIPTAGSNAIDPPSKSLRRPRKTFGSSCSSVSGYPGPLNCSPSSTYFSRINPWHSNASPIRGWK